MYHVHLTIEKNTSEEVLEIVKIYEGNLVNLDLQYQTDTMINFYPIKINPLVKNLKKRFADIEVSIIRIKVECDPYHRSSREFSKNPTKYPEKYYETHYKLKDSDIDKIDFYLLRTMNYNLHIAKSSLLDSMRYVTYRAHKVTLHEFSSHKEVITNYLKGLGIEFEIPFTEFSLYDTNLFNDRISESLKDKSL